MPRPCTRPARRRVRRVRPFDEPYHETAAMGSLGGVVAFVGAASMGAWSCQWVPSRLSPSRCFFLAGELCRQGAAGTEEKGYCLKPAMHWGYPWSGTMRPSRWHHGAHAPCRDAPASASPWMMVDHGCPGYLLGPCLCLLLFVVPMQEASGGRVSAAWRRNGLLSTGVVALPWRLD